MSTAGFPHSDVNWIGGTVGRVRTCEPRQRINLVPASVGLLACLFGTLVVLFQLLRLCLYIRNRDLALDADVAAIAGAFWIGLRFDMAVVSYMTVPLLIVAALGRVWRRSESERRVYTIGYAACGVLFTVFGLGELEFYREYSARYNILAIQYWSHPAEVLSMIWNGYPVLRYLALAAVLSGVYVSATVGLGRLWFPSSAGPVRSCGWLEWSWTAVIALMLFVAARGGLRGSPLQRGDDAHSASTFANHLAYNGIWTLSRELVDTLEQVDAARFWHYAMPREEACERLHRLMLLPHEQLTGDPDKYPLLRLSYGANRSVNLHAVAGQSPNVVVIMMESFSARHVGALGANGGHTPEFDRIADRGILFDQCLSNGTRTHQAHYAIGTSFPNLPNSEWLMQNRWGNQKFDSVPAELKRRGYQTLYLCNGNLTWDNVRDFFTRQGIDRFLGADDFDSSVFKGTWGVLDNVLFERANREFAKIDGPFFAMIMTASNHVPFQHPRPYPFPEVTDAGEYNSRLNGVRFADWSIGQFFELASKQRYFRNTLFVLVGDHGHKVPEGALTELHLLSFHVPLLFFAPELLGDEPRRIHTVASHVDIGPTILGLLGDDNAHQHWGRDIFALSDDDPGFAIFRPTGEQAIGFARGDTLLVETKNGKNHVYRFDLRFPARATEVTAPDINLVREMDKDLQAYMETAHEVLTDRRVSP